MKKARRYLVLVLGMIILWRTPIVAPFKLLSVYFHELGHSFMALIFGNGISGFKIDLDESGYAIVSTKGWFSSFMITNGGYLGSLIFGLLILYISETKFKNLLLGFISIVMLAISFLYSGITDFTFVFSLIFFIVVILIYKQKNRKLMELVIDIIGITSVVYAIYDAFVDTILFEMGNILLRTKGSAPATDAQQLERLTHIPAIVWGILWLMISFYLIRIWIKWANSKNSVK